jgi:transcriptional regulator with XRE-family HTH domain
LNQQYLLFLEATFMSGISDLQAVYAKIAVEPLEIRLARNIATRRKVLGLTQAQLAEKLSVETETLSRFERGKHLPSLATLERLAGLLQVTVSELLAEQPKIADDDALVISSWIAHLDEDDKRFARTILKQCCEHLEAKSKLLGS